MNKQHKAKAVSIFLVTVMISSLLPAVAGQTGGQTIDEVAVDPFSSFRFIQNSQNIELNSLKDLNDMHNYIGVYYTTGKISQIDAITRGLLIVRLQSYQNADGGFGDWEQDRSKAGSTRIALETLEMLGASPLNETAAASFIEKLQVSGLTYGNYGFRSSVKESDADVSTTYDAVKALTILNAAIPNQTGVIDYVHQHRNSDGGYGYQTNREANVFWPSTMIHTQRALLTLDLLGTGPEQEALTLQWIEDMQSAQGGFSNTGTTNAKVAYTLAAVKALDAINQPIPRQSQLISFVTNLQTTSGMWIEYDLDTQEGVHTTHDALELLARFSSQPDPATAISAVEDHFTVRIDGGFGNEPGQDSTIRLTFDSVLALNSIGRLPNNRTATIQFLQGLQNADGGYGLPISSVESTYRVVSALLNLGVNPNNSELTVEYLLDSQNSDGGFGFTNGRQSTGAYTYRAIRALDLLGEVPRNSQGAIEYLQGLQNQDGGFVNAIGLETGLGATYRAVRGLDILDADALNEAGTIAFIKRHQRYDGGFSMGEDPFQSPRNISTSVQTYNAISALAILGSAPDNVSLTSSFIKSLRNPDLGFADKVDFTSEVDDSFTAIVALMRLHPQLNTAPGQLNLTTSKLEYDAGETVLFNASWDDVDNQIASKVFLNLDGEKILMNRSNLQANLSNLTLQTTIGTHQAFLEVSDGYSITRSETIQFAVKSVGQAPEINISVTPDEGGPSTEITVLGDYFDADNDPASWVKMSVDDGPWIKMSLNSTTGLYEWKGLLSPGRHSIRLKANDGVNSVYSDPVQSPLIIASSVSQPHWDIYLKLAQTVEEIYGEELELSAFSSTLFEGQQAWKAQLSTGDEAYFTYDGESELIASEGTTDNPLDGYDQNQLMMLGLGIVSLLLLLTLLLRGRKKEPEVSKWQDQENLWNEVNV